MKPEVRKTVIAGNWKMNKTPAEAVALLNELRPLVADAKCDVVVGVPFVCIPAVAECVSGTNIAVAAQNVHWAKSGAFTGEISVDMLKAVGATYAIIGHSERRQYFGETDETVNKRVLAALEGGLKVILCVGELLSEREQNITFEVVSKQTKIALAGVSAEDVKNNVIIAYEPVWAIGTGKTATSDQAEEVCAYIRGVVASLYGEAVAEGMTVQYGGSMNAGNAEDLLSKTNVDGGLIGGASLKAADFSVIVSAASKQ